MALKEDDRILLTIPTGYIDIFIGRGDMHDFEIVQDAVEPKLKIRLKDEDGNDFSLASGSATFNMIKAKTGAFILNAGTFALDDAAAGKISYNWSDANVTAEVGVFTGRITATQSGGSATPIPEIIRITVLRKHPSS